MPVRAGLSPRVAHYKFPVSSVATFCVCVVKEVCQTVSETWARLGTKSRVPHLTVSAVPQVMHSVKMVSILPMGWVPVAQTGWRSNSWKSMVPKSFLMCLKESSLAAWPGPMTGRECSTTHTPSRTGRVMVRGDLRDAPFHQQRGDCSHLAMKLNSKSQLI